MLSLPLRARREDTLAQSDFAEWIVKHIDCWFAFARRLGLGIEQMEEIILVTGFDRTRSWFNVAFSGGQLDAVARVSFGVNAVGGVDSSINFQFSPEHVQGAVLNQGPEGRVRCSVFRTRGSEMSSTDMTLSALELTRESMCIYQGVSCRSYLPNIPQVS